ncbi:Tlg2-vesicle protein [Mortierella sp. GBA30]|nr:Tlg2-vesicle protein [Mortierella sp. GBA30]
MSGYVYGFVFGFLIAFSSALAGSIVCFYFCRRWFKAHVRKLLAKNKNLKGVLRTVEKRGFKLLVLIRLAPYPFNIMNALLSATHIPLPIFGLATAMSLVKLMLHVYIGSTLSSLAGGTDEGDKHGKALKIVVMILSIILGMGVGGYVWIVAKREVAITEALRIERRRQRRRRQDGAENEVEGAGGLELNNQGRIPDLDITNQGSFDELFESRERHLAAATSNYVRQGYHDDEDDGHEDQSLFGNLSLGRRIQHEGGDWRNVDANVDSSTDSDNSDIFDDEEEDDDGDRDVADVERRGVHYDPDDQVDEALDFSAHHMDLVESPWQNEVDLEDGALLPLSSTDREVSWGQPQ